MSSFDSSQYDEVLPHNFRKKLTQNEQEEEEEEKEKEKQGNIIDEDEVICFKIERLVHHFMTNLAIEVESGESLENEMYDFRVPTFVFNKATFSFEETERGKVLTLQSQAFARTFLMLNFIHTNVRQGKSVTQREMYYCAKAKEPLVFSKVSHVLDAIKNVAGMLQTSRVDLNITTVPKGLCAGYLTLENHFTNTVIDCSNEESNGFSIPGDLKQIEYFKMNALHADFILIVEKDAVFSKLVQEKIWLKYPCVIITAKGFPDFSTRAFIKRLVSTAIREETKIFVLVDWNPMGLWIFLTYATGGAQNACETKQYALPEAIFLGLNHSDINAATVLTAKHTKKETSMISKALKQKNGPLYDTFKEELEQMYALGRKCEIEGLYAGDSDNYSLSDYIGSKVYASGD
jgi:meiotic recombination protein SPO11